MYFIERLQVLYDGVYDLVPTLKVLQAETAATNARIPGITIWA